ncbi:MAG: M20/M25/M40 family metallo-hydrolase, partial [Pyrinomonadaceae bacterium]
MDHWWTTTRRSFQTLLIFLLLPALVSAQQVAPAPAKLSAAEIDLADRVKVDSIRNYVTALSADDMQGRGTAQPGGDKAAQYIADQFARLKLTPQGDKGSYFQSVKFRELTWAPETTLKIGDEEYKLGPDFVPVPLYGGDKTRAGDLVFVAYGLQARQPERDDLTGVDLSGKIAVVMNGPPPGISKKSWDSSGVKQQILGSLFQRDVSGIILIQNAQEEHPYAELADYLSRRQIERADGPGMPGFIPPIYMVSDATAEKLFTKSGRTFAQAKTNAEGTTFKPYGLKQSAKLVLKGKTTKGNGNNVAALLEGSDQKLREEAIVFTAHYDAFGTAANGRVYPGAADNGLGVAEMLAVAEAFTSAPARPKRSIIFLAVTGEEYGGLGSEYWVGNPTWNIKRVAADLNLDGMGTEVYGPVKTIVGFGAEHSSLGPMLIDVVAANNLLIIPDPMPDEKAFYRSDHYMFV